MNRLFPFAAIVLLVSLGSTLPMPARAAQSYDNCTGFIDSVPATVSTQGTWCLHHDLNTAITSGMAINVAANNVTIDCNDFKLGGLAAGTGTNTLGVYINGRYNVTVRHCNIRGFRSGVDSSNGGSTLVENNSFDSNTLYGMFVASPGSTVRGNRVIDTGGSTSAPGAAYGIFVAGDVEVLDNTVNGVAATPDGGGAASAFGILTNISADANVVGNRVRGLAASGAGTTFGIRNSDSGRVITRDNDVQGTGVANSVGVECTDNQGTARDNVIAGFATGVSNCTSDGNTVNPN